MDLNKVDIVQRIVMNLSVRFGGWSDISVSILGRDNSDGGSGFKAFKIAFVIDK